MSTHQDSKQPAAPAHPAPTHPAPGSSGGRLFTVSGTKGSLLVDLSKVSAIQKNPDGSFALFVDGSSHLIDDDKAGDIAALFKAAESASDKQPPASSQR